MNINERKEIMTQQSTISRMYLANIIEENEQGFHRESLWFGSMPQNLGLMIIDAMKDWYEPNKNDLNASIIKYHEMLEDKDNLTFDMMEGEGFDADGMKISVELSNDLNNMFGFIVCEICNIFAKNGETPETFKSLAEFKEHFIKEYDIDKEFQEVLEGINEASVSKALYLIDMKYDYTGRHFRSSKNVS